MLSKYNMKLKFFFIFLFYLFSPYIICSQSNVQENIVDSELQDLVNDLNNQDYEKEISEINNLISQMRNFAEGNDSFDFSKYTDCLIPTDTDDFKVLPLSEKLKIMRQNSQIENQMTSDFINSSSKTTSMYIEQADLVQKLIYHTGRAIDILCSIVEANNDSLSIAIDSIAELQQANADLQIKASSLSLQIDLLNESLAYARIQSKRSYVVGNVIIPVVSIAGLIPSMVLMSDGNDKGYDLLMVDLAFFAGCELVWNSGHLVFKWW